MQFWMLIITFVKFCVRIANSISSKILRDVVNTNWFAKFIVLVVVWIVALIPSLISWFAFSIANPVGFWQTFAMAVLCLCIFGAPQLGLGILGVMFTVVIICEEMP